MKRKLAACLLGLVVLAGIGASVQQAVTREEFDDVTKRLQAVETKAAMLDVRLKALEKPRVAEAGPATAQTTARAEATTADGVTLSGFATRLVDRSNAFYTYSWKVSLTNTNPTDKMAFVTVTAYDKDGFKLDDAGGMFTVPRNSTVAVSDRFMIEAKQVPALAAMRPGLEVHDVR